MNTLLMGYNRIQLVEIWGEPDSVQSNEDIWIKIGTETGSIDIFDITEDFRKLECNAGIVVTLTVSDEIVE